jgi:hypothetical protein
LGGTPWVGTDLRSDFLFASDSERFIVFTLWFAKQTIMLLTLTFLIRRAKRAILQIFCKKMGLSYKPNPENLTSS